MRACVAIAPIVALVWAAGCSDSPGQGGARQSCYSNGTCNPGLTCLSMLCVEVRGDAAAGASGEAGSSGAAGGAAGAAGVTGSAVATGSAGAGNVAGATGAAGAGGSGMGGKAGTTGTAGTSGASGAAGGAGGGAGTAGSDAGVRSDASADAGDTSVGVDFNVAGLPNVVLWLNSIQGLTTEIGGNGRIVDSWKDQSGHGNDARNQGYNPLFIPGAVNGLPAIQLSMTSMMAAGGPTLLIGKNEYIVEVVARWKTLGSNLSVPFQMPGPIGGTSINSQTRFALYEDLDGRMLLRQYDQITSVTLISQQSMFGDGTFRVVGARRVGTNAAAVVEVRVNGVVQDMLTSNGAGLDLGSMTAPAFLGPGNELQIAEVVVINGPTSPDDLARLESYLMKKYRLQ